MSAPAVTLAPVIRTVMLPGFRSARVECWQAETPDGIWRLGREESSGTPWVLIHKPTGLTVSTHGTMRSGRKDIASGQARADLERLQAHERGEHAAARDSWCGMCH